MKPQQNEPQRKSSRQQPTNPLSIEKIQENICIAFPELSTRKEALSVLSSNENLRRNFLRSLQSLREASASPVRGLFLLNVIYNENRKRMRLVEQSDKYGFNSANKENPNEASRVWCELYGAMKNVFKNCANRLIRQESAISGIHHPELPMRNNDVPFMLKKPVRPQKISVQ